MFLILAVVAGGLFACGAYLILARSIIRLIFGIILLSHAANLLIFSSAGLTRAHPPLIPPARQALEPPYADPLPQALILTAIVISFSVVAFSTVLVQQAYRELGSDDSDQMRESP